MKLFFKTLVFVGIILIEGVPNNYEHRIQSRSISELPVINWFYNNSPDQYASNEEIKVVPMDKLESSDEPPEPLENFLAELKDKSKKTGDTDGKTVTLLTELKNTLSETPTNLAKVFINKAWHVFDLGRSGTSRRTRNIQEVSYLLVPFQILLGLINQLARGMHLGGATNLQNDTQSKSLLHNLLFPFSYLTNLLYGSPTVHQKILEKIADSANQKPEPSSYNDPGISNIFIIDKRHKENANHLLNGKTPNEILSKVNEYLDRDNLEPEEMFYIVWKVYDLFSNLSNNDEETNLELIEIINKIGKDSRFDSLFEIFKTKDDPEFQKIWKLFKKSQPKLDQYLSVDRHPSDGGKSKDQLPENCFIVGPNDQITKTKRKRSRYESEDENKTLVTRDLNDLNSTSHYRICCIDDKNESKANRLLGEGSNDEVLSKIKKNLNQNKLDPEYAWYNLLKLYQMLKNPDKLDDKNKNEINDMTAEVGKDPKFKTIFESIELKNDPRLREIQKLFKPDPKKVEEVVKPPPAKEADPNSQTLKYPPTNKTEPEKVIKNEKGPSKRPIEDIKKANPLPLGTPVDEKIQKPSIATPLKQTQAAVLSNNQQELNNVKITFPNLARTLHAHRLKEKVHRYTSKPEILYSDLEEVENLLKDPALDSQLRQDLISHVRKWYDTFFQNEKIKKKLDELVHFIKGTPDYDKSNETPTPTEKISEHGNHEEASRVPLKPLLLNNQDSDKRQSLTPFRDLARERNARLIKDKIDNLKSKNEISYADLETVENLLKDPSLDLPSKRDLVNIIRNWNATISESEKVKRKLGEMVLTMKGNPEYNEIYDKSNPNKKELHNLPEKVAEPLKKPSVVQINGMSGGVLDNFLKNVGIMLKAPSSEPDTFSKKKYLVKLIYSWRQIDNLDENLKQKLDEIIDTVKNDPESYRFLEETRQAS